MLKKDKFSPLLFLASSWNKTWKKKKIQTRTGFEPMTFAIPIQVLFQLLVQ